MYINTRKAVPIRRTLEEMGHPQPKRGTPVQANNSVADAVANSNVAPRRLKSMDQKLWWIRDREAQDQFRFFCASGVLTWGTILLNIMPRFTT